MVRLLADGALRYLSVTLSIALADATSKYHANQSKPRSPKAHGRRPGGVIDLLERIFTHVAGVRALIAALAECAGSLSPEESACIARARDRRRREFIAGRVLAKKTLAGLGKICDSLPAHELRHPKWPEGYIGSISHSRTLVTAVVARTPQLAGLGIDVERARSVTPDLHRSLFTASERTLIDREAANDVATVLFSCKESVYKAVFPRFREFLEFGDVELAIDGSGFSAVCAATKSSAAAIRQGQGFITEYAGHVVSLFTIR